MTGTDTNATAQAPDDGVMGMDAPERIWVDITLVDSPLAHPIDRARINAIRTEAKP
jgi:hypothetical protein